MVANVAETLETIGFDDLLSRDRAASDQTQKNSDNFNEALGSLQQNLFSLLCTGGDFGDVADI